MKAVFTLASKIAPSVVFVDEVGICIKVLSLLTGLPFILAFKRHLGYFVDLRT